MFEILAQSQLENLLSTHWAEELLKNWGVSENMMKPVILLVDLFILAIISVLIDWLSRKIILRIIKKIVMKTKATWDDYLFEQRVFLNLSHIIPALVVKMALPIVLSNYKAAIPYIEVLVNAYIIVLLAIVAGKVLKALEKFSKDQPEQRHKPMRTIIQVFRILNIFLALILLISLFLKTPPGTILGALAGTTAILILIFQDPINGLLANFQINMYDLAREGDWVSFERYGADGNILSIDLTTVKIRNFDNTISTVPARTFTSESFVNWRGMQETQVRRIKRNILIDIDSIRFCDRELLESFRKIDLVKDYIFQRQDEIDSYNQLKGFDNQAALINGRQQTNIGIFRQYVARYLEWHPMVSNDHTMMTRQLQPTPQGVPIEVYCFSSTIVWPEYEKVQADIFDHLYAASQFFGLRLYQAPSGRDIRAVGPGGPAAPPLPASAEKE